MTIRQKLTIIDAIGVALIVLGIAITVMSFLAARGTVASVQSFTIRQGGPSVHEIAPGPAGNNL
ncbi:MAG: hypothetical protein ACRECP_04295 [Methylocella sp.]